MALSGVLAGGHEWFEKGGGRGAVNEPSGISVEKVERGI